VLPNLNIDDLKSRPPDCTCASSPFIYNSTGCVITGDLKCINNTLILFYAIGMAYEIIDTDWSLKYGGILDLTDLWWRILPKVMPSLLANDSFSVITGDLKCINNTSLQDVFAKGPKYREPKSISWKHNFKILIYGFRRGLCQTIGKTWKGGLRYSFRMGEECEVA
jgi:hypothetical protein